MFGIFCFGDLANTFFCIGGPNFRVFFMFGIFCFGDLANTFFCIGGPNFRIPMLAASGCKAARV